MLLEQERLLSTEENSVNDNTSHNSGMALCNWTNLFAKTVVTTGTSHVVIRFRATFMTNDLPYSGGTLSGGVQILNGATRLVGTGYQSLAIPSAAPYNYVEREVFLELAAGTYTINCEYSIVQSSNLTHYYIDVSGVQIGIFALNDSDVTDGGATVNVMTVTETEIIAKTITTPAVRQIPVGRTKKVNALVIVDCRHPSLAVDLMKNAGEANTANRMNWKIYQNSVQKSWTTRKDDYQAITPAYCIGAYGIYTVELDPDTAYTFSIRAYNGDAISNLNLTAYISVIYSPWIFTDTLCQIFDLDVPEGSTTYILMEPFFRNPTKYAYLGKVRAASFGDSTDYYEQAVGAGILSWGYAFESILVIGNLMTFKGLGGLISAVAVDVR